MEDTLYLLRKLASEWRGKTSGPLGELYNTCVLQVTNDTGP
jgi:hypothetical protein